MAVCDADQCATRRQLSDLLEGSPHAVVVHSEGLIRYANHAAAGLFGIADRATAIGSRLLDHVHPSSRDDVAARVTRLMRGETKVGAVEVRMVRADGSTIVLETIGARTVWDGGPAVEVVMWDVTGRVETEKRLAWGALHDPLTGLANRQLLDQHLAVALKSGQPVAVLCLDLDRFKPVNDEFGHTVGDELLRCVAHRLGSSVREEDLVARVGGDEFVVVAEGVADLPAALALADQVRGAVTQPVQIGGNLVRVGASVGAAVSTPVGCSPAQLLLEADRLMYQAKAAQRTRLSARARPL